MTCKHFQTQEENYNNKGSATWVILIKGVRCTKKFKKHCSKRINIVTSRLPHHNTAVYNQGSTHIYLQSLTTVVSPCLRVPVISPQLHNCTITSINNLTKCIHPNTTSFVLYNNKMRIVLHVYLWYRDLLLYLLKELYSMFIFGIRISSYIC